MRKAEDIQYVAVSIPKVTTGPFMPPFGLTNILTFAVVATVEGASFTSDSGPFRPEGMARARPLIAHGFTVVQLPEDWHYSMGEWQGGVLEAAMDKVKSLYGDIPGQASVNYDHTVTESVLEAINAGFPRPVNLIQIKATLSREPSDAELLLALDALKIEGLIHGQGIPGQYAVRDLNPVGLVQITREGRERFSGKTVSGRGNSVVYGDHIINYGQAGAIGRKSTGQITNLAEGEAPINTQELVTEIRRLRMTLQAQAQSREDFQQLGVLADAEEHAEKDEPAEMFGALARSKHHLIKLAQEIGASVLAKVIEQALGLS